MKTTAARNNSGDDWKTPDEFYNKLDKVYHFDFDPCPYQADFDGLNMEWGKSNFVNPPYSRKLKEAFVHKALEQKAKGKRQKAKEVYCYCQLVQVLNCFMK